MRIDLQNTLIGGSLAVIAISVLLLITPGVQEFRSSEFRVFNPEPGTFELRTFEPGTFELRTPNQVDTLIYSTIAQRTYNPTPAALPLSRTYTAAEIDEATARHSVNQRYCCKVADNGGESLDWSMEWQWWSSLKISAKYHAGNIRYEWGRRDQHVAAIGQRIERTWQRFTR